jgi:hypothetical protein
LLFISSTNPFRGKQSATLYLIIAEVGTKYFCYKMGVGDVIVQGRKWKHLEEMVLTL